MLKTLTSDEARGVSLLAKAARAERDKLLGNVPEEDLGEAEPARGEHNPAAALGFEPLDQRADPLELLRRRIAELAPEARAELYALMRLGRGDGARRDWDRRVAEGDAMEELVLTAALMEDADLHLHLAKGLYEIEAAGEGRRPR